MHRHLSVALSAATAVAAFALSACSPDRTSRRVVARVLGAAPQSRVRSPAPPTAALPAPEALTDVLNRLADPNVPGVNKVSLVEGATPESAQTPGQVHQRIARQRLPAHDLCGKQHRMVGQESVQCDGHRQRQHRPSEQRRLHVPDGVHALPRGLAVVPAHRGDAAGSGQLTGRDAPRPGRDAPRAGTDPETTPAPVPSPPG